MNANLTKRFPTVKLRANAGIGALVIAALLAAVSALRAHDPAASVMDPESDAPGGDDDASGTEVSIECARLLSKGTYRATLLFVAVSEEEQGPLSGKRPLEYLPREHGLGTPILSRPLPASSRPHSLPQIFSPYGDDGAGG